MALGSAGVLFMCGAARLFIGWRWSNDTPACTPSAERGKVTGTAVGCACGDGVIDWKAVVDLCKKAPRDIVFSVECGTVDQARRSIEHLRSLL